MIRPLTQALRLAAVVLLVLASQAQAGEKTVDKKFFAVSAFNAGALAFDAYTTARVISRSKGCYEGGEPWLLGRYPSAGRVAGVAIGEYALGEGVSYFLKRSHNRMLRRYLWPAPVGYRAGVHLAAGVHNLYGCP